MPIQSIPENTAAKLNVASYLRDKLFATYAELSPLAGGDVQTSKRYILAAARKLLLKEEPPKVFECVKGQGVKRLSNDEIPATLAATCKSVRNKTKLGQLKLSACDPSALNPTTRASYHASATLLGAIDLFTKHRKRIEAVVAVTQHKIDTERLFDLFRTESQQALPALR